MIMMMMMTKKRKQLYCASIYIEKAIKATTTATAILFTFATQHNKNNTNACKICFLLLNSSRVEPDWHRRRRIVIVLCWCYCCSSFCCCCCYFCLSPLFRFLSWFVCMYVCMFTQNSFFLQRFNLICQSILSTKSAHIVILRAHTLSFLPIIRFQFFLQQQKK